MYLWISRHQGLFLHFVLIVVQQGLGVADVSAYYLLTGTCAARTAHLIRFKESFTRDSINVTYALRFDDFGLDGHR